MKKIMTVISMLAMIVVLSAEQSLWEKAMEIAAENWNWIPRLTTTTSETKNLKSQELEGSTELVVKHNLYEGIIINELVTSSINGQEESLEEASKRYIEILQRDNTPTRSGMFFHVPGEEFTLKNNGKDKQISGFDCIGFDFSYRDEESKKKSSGTVWLDKKSGAPILKEFSPDKNPRFVTGIDMIMHYHYNPDNGEWYAKTVDSNVHISAMGRKMISNTTVSYSEHWRYHN